MIAPFLFVQASSCDATLRGGPLLYPRTFFNDTFSNQLSHSGLTDCGGLCDIQFLGGEVLLIPSYI